MRFRFAIVAAVNDDQVLRTALQASPMVANGAVSVLCERGHDCAGKAYNAGLRRANADYVIFAHQDVYFPLGWEKKLTTAIELLGERAEAWAVLGVWGAADDGALKGRVWCNVAQKEYRGDVAEASEVVSVDEVVIVLRADSGLRFDEDLPGFHLYGTDIIQQARRDGFKAFVFDGPIVHCNKSSPLDQNYFTAYRYLQRKWHAHLPVATTIMPITRRNWSMWRWRFRNWRKRRPKTTELKPSSESPVTIARRLAYEA